MTEQELRALVREAIARHVSATTEGSRGFRPADSSGFRPPESSSFRLQAEDQRPQAQETRVAPNGRILTDPAHAMFRLEPPGGDTACIIEPSVTCTHCGYCKSYGH